MILKKIILQNFGPYGGRQAIELQSDDGERPITLISALNGSGKTTLLDALLLALYGKRARCAGRAKLPYTKFLKRSVHQGPAVVGVGASVEVMFERLEGDERRVYHVARSWMREGTLRERVEVMIDGYKRDDLSVRWDEVVEEILPERIAHLFFFDGEKIESYAQPETAAALLRTAVHSLLGLDLVDRLKSDLVKLQRRELKGQADPKLQQEISQGEQRLEESQDDQKRNGALIEGLDVELQETRLELASVESEYRAAGGALLEEKEALEASLRELQSQIGQEDDRLRDLARGSAPLLLVKGLCQRLQGQLSAEFQSGQNQALVGMLEARDEELMKRVATAARPEAVEVLSAYLAEDRAGRRAVVANPILIDATAATETKLSHWLAGSEDLLSEVAAVRETRAARVHDAVVIEDQIQAAPDERALAERRVRREAHLTAHLQSRNNQLHGRTDQQTDQTLSGDCYRQFKQIVDVWKILNRCSTRYGREY